MAEQQQLPINGTTQPEQKVRFKDLSPAQLREMAAAVEATLPGLQGDDLKKAKKLVTHYKYHADFKESGGLNRAQQKAKAAGQPIPAAKPKAPKEKIKTVVAKKAAASSTTKVPEQGLLPGFTEVVVPRSDEIAREMVFNALRNQIAQMGVELENIRQLFKKA